MIRIIFLLFSILCCSHISHAQYKVDRLLVSGRVALHYEDYVLSIQYFNQAISQKPYLWEPWQYRAIAKYCLEDWKGAVSDATKAIELNPYITTLYDLRGISYIKQNNYEMAIADYSSAIRLEPDNQNYWYNRAVCYLETKNFDKTQEELDTIIKKWHKYPMAYLMKVETYLHQSDTVSAKEWLDKTIEIDAYNADAWRIKAFLALSDGDWKNADAYFTKSLSIRPKNAACYANRASARLKLNNLRGAMSDYDTALDLQPNDILAHYNRGLLRQQVGDDNRAIEDFDFVLELEPDNVMALFNRATLLDRTGDLRAAIRDYTKVLNHFPDFWTGLQYRAACYRKLGQTALAELDEFKVLKARMNKHLGIQKRWSRSKLSAMRKLNDIDPNKYNHLVVNDVIENNHDYKSDYRGKVQNRQASMMYQPYIAMTLNAVNTGISSYSPFDSDIEVYVEKLRAIDNVRKTYTMPKLGGVGEGTGLPTFEIIDRLTEDIDNSKDTELAEMLLLLRSVAYSTAQNYQEALNDIDTYLAIHPESVVGLWQRAVCNAMMAEFDLNASPEETALRKAGVISDFEKLESATKDNALVFYCHATFCARRGDYETALDLLNKTIELDPTLPQAYYNRGMIYVNLGRTPDATNDLGKAGELGMYQAYSILKSITKKK